MRTAAAQVRVLDLPEFHAFLERARDFIGEYAWHHRACAAADPDGDWHKGNPPCDCGYDEALAALTDWREVAP